MNKAGGENSEAESFCIHVFVVKLHYKLKGFSSETFLQSGTDGCFQSGRRFLLKTQKISFVHMYFSKNKTKFSGDSLYKNSLKWSGQEYW